MLTPDGKVVIPNYLPASTLTQYPEYVREQVEFYFNTHPYSQELQALQDEASAKQQRLKEAPATSTPPQPPKGMVTVPRKQLFDLLPSPEGLARAIGFSNFTTMRKAIENPDINETSKHYMLCGCSIIADILTRAGLFEKLNTTFSKFIMSAYLGINERTEAHTINDTRINISWRTPELTQDDNTIIEMQALENKLPQSMQITYVPTTSDLVEVNLAELF